VGGFADESRQCQARITYPTTVGSSGSGLSVGMSTTGGPASRTLIYCKTGVFDECEAAVVRVDVEAGGLIAADGLRHGPDGQGCADIEHP
jgi:hypothetical protein